MTMLRLKNRISHRLFAALFLLAVIPVCLMGYGTYRAAQKTLIDTAYMHIHTVAKDQEARLDTWFDERLKDIRVLSELPGVRHISVASGRGEDGDVRLQMEDGLLSNILALTRAKSPSYESIHILDPSGKLLASTNPQSEMLTGFRYMEDLEAAKKVGGAYLTPVHQHSDQRWYMHLFAPVNPYEEKTSAFVMAILDASATLDPILSNRAGLGDTGEAYLVNEEGRIITESKYLERSETRNRVFQTRGIKAALAQEEGTAIYENYMGREVAGSFVWLPSYRWGLLAEMEKDEILAPLRNIRAAIVWTTATVAFLCVLVALAMSRRISRPIIEMATASRSIAQGSLEQRISYSGSDEIGTLSQSFNVMAEKLALLIDSLRRKEASLQKAYDDLIQTQQQLVQSEKMAAIGELVASVVHEMRNPLSSVKLNYQIIGRTIEAQSPLSEHYRIGLDQISQLDRMFSDLLEYSRPVALKISPLHINEIVHQGLVQIEGLIKDQDIRIINHVDGMLPPILGDSDKIRQVVVNVVKNAIEAAGRGGKVEIAANVLQTAGRPSVSVEVTDNGPGVPPQDLKRIFQPFYTTKKKGTGLGLSIVKKIMDAHQFEIGVESREGIGTVVRLRFHGASPL